MKIIRMFILASEELSEEVSVLANVVMELNNRMSAEGVVVLLERLPIFQHNEINNKTDFVDCDRCVVAFWKTVDGKVQNQMDNAYIAQQQGLKPKKINVLFKFQDESELQTEERNDVRELYNNRFIKQERFPDHFENFDTLKLKFLGYFLEEIKTFIRKEDFVTIEDGKAMIDGKVYVDLSQVRCFANNEYYINLEEEIKELEEDIKSMDVSNPRYLMKIKRLNESKQRKTDMEKNIWNTSLELARMANERCSERLRRAIVLLENGDNQGASALLNEEEISHDVRCNQQKIKIGKEGKDGLRINIEEYKTKINSVKNMMNDGWVDKVRKLYEMILDAARDYVEDAYLLELLLEYADFLDDEQYYESAEKILLEVLSLYDNLSGKEQGDILNKKADALDMLAGIHNHMEKFEDAEKEYMEVRRIREDMSANNPDAYKPLLAATISDMGAMYMNMREYDKSYQSLMLSRDIFLNMKPEMCDDYGSSIVLLMNNISTLCKERLMFKEAEDNYETAMNLLEKCSQINKEFYFHVKAVMLNNIALVHHKTKNFDAAIEEYEESIQIYRELSNRNPEKYLSHLAFTLINYSSMYIDMDDCSKSETYIAEALDIYGKLISVGNTSCFQPYADAIKNSAYLHRRQNDLSASEEKYKLSLTIYKYLSENNLEKYIPKIAETENDLAVMYQDKGEFQNSESSFNEALRLFTFLSERNPETYLHEVASTLKNMGLLHERMDKLDIAEGEYDKSIKIFDEIFEDNRCFYLTEYVKSLLVKALLLGKQGRLNEAEGVYSTILNLYENNRMDMSDIDKTNEIAAIKSFMPILLQLGKQKEFLSLCDKMIKLDDSTYMVMNDCKGVILLDMNRSNEALSVFEEMMEYNTEAAYNSNLYKTLFSMGLLNN